MQLWSRYSILIVYTKTKIYMSSSGKLNYIKSAIKTASIWALLFVQKRLIFPLVFIIVFTTAYYITSSFFSPQDKARAAANVWAATGNPLTLGYGDIPFESVPQDMSNVSRASKVYPGTNHTLILMNDSTLWATGLNRNGQLGNEQIQYVNSLTRVTNMTNVIQAGSGSNFSVALKNDGTVWTWGASSNGRLGYTVANSGNQLIPKQVLGISNVVEIAVGQDHVLARRIDNSVWTWGRNVYGQLGLGNNTDINQPTQINSLSGVIDIEAGSSLSVALKNDGRVFAWGLNNASQLGLDIDPDNAVNTFRNSPQQVIGLTTITSLGQMSPNSSSVIARDSNGYLWEWGLRTNMHTQGLYDNSAICYGTTFQCRVRQLNLISNVREFAYSSTNVLYKLSTNEIYYNGDSTSGQSGNGTIQTYANQVNLTNVIGSGALQLAVGGLSNMVVKINGTIKVWGSNNVNQLGYNPTPTNKFEPFQLNSSNQIVDYSTSGNLSAIIVDDGSSQNKGTVWTWGPNYFGQLGNGTVSNTIQDVPTSIGLTNVTQVVAQSQGGGTILALKSDGTVWGWGHNNYGQVAGSGNTNEPTPTQITGLLNIIKIKEGCALESDNDLWCWGLQRNSEFGLGSTNNGDKLAPVRVSQNVVDWDRSIDVSTSNMVIARTDGTVWTAGSAESGFLGRGSLIDSKDVWQQIQGLSNIQQVSLGKALSVNGNTRILYSWGIGNIGNNLDQIQLAPVQITTLENPLNIKRDRFVSTVGNIYEYTNPSSLIPAKLPYIANVSRFGSGVNGSTFVGDLIEVLNTSQIPSLTFACLPGSSSLTTTCTFQLPSLTRTDENFKLAIANSINSVTPGGNCSSDSNGLVTCTSVPIGLYSGATESQLYSIFAQTGSDPTTDTGENVLVYNIAYANPGTIENSQDCTLMTTVAIGEVITCFFPLTGSTSNSYQLPFGGIVSKIASTSSSSSACNIINNNTTTVSLKCENIPTAGGTTGAKDVQIIINNSVTGIDRGDITLTNTIGGTSIVAANTSSSTISSTSPCTFSTLVSVPNTYTCSFALSGASNNTYALPLGGIVARTEQSTLVSANSQPCGILGNGTASAQLVCSDIPSNSQSSSFVSGAANVTLQFGGNGIFSDKGDITLSVDGNIVVSSELNSNDIPSLKALTGFDCKPDSITINTIINCSGTLPSSKRSPSLGLRVRVDGTSQSVPCAFSNNTPGATFSCNSITTGRQTGIRNIQAAIGASSLEQSNTQISPLNLFDNLIVSAQSSNYLNTGETIVVITQSGSNLSLLRSTSSNPTSTVSGTIRTGGYIPALIALIAASAVTGTVLVLNRRKHLKIK